MSQPNHYAAERLAARAANYRTQVARLRALITPDAETDTTDCPEETS